MASLGYAYADGRGVAKNDVEAAKWIEKAALKNNANAQGHLAVKYLEGRGVPKDLARAGAWFPLASINVGNSADEKNRHFSYQMPWTPNCVRNRRQKLYA